MTGNQVDRLIWIVGVGIGSFVLAYFLTNLHRSAQAGQFVYTYNTVTGEVIIACGGTACDLPSHSN